MTNRLADSLSPYLRQHADNPVDWREWDDATFAEARERDVPVFLSVGYAACHWCHVMAHDSFEDEQVAQVLRDGFVSVKVDREERPDVDAVYMRATLAMTGQGGWPMTCLLTPSGDPFFAGTYLPKAQLLQLLAAAQDAWTNRRDQVVASGANVAAQLSAVAVPTGSSALDVDVLDRAAEQLGRQFDWQRGGFGGAPKFPPSMVLEFLLRQHARTGDERSLRMVDETCEAMARGGLYDQLGGGFARYSVDADWIVPHFEKMLYDNAQLMSVYAHLWRLTGSGLARRVALETADFVVGRLGTDEGAFASALDADTDGVEGATYAWTPAQLVDLLGEEDGARAADLLRVTLGGTFEHGTSTLQLREEPSDPAWWERVRRTLAEARDTRPQPARDDKVVTSWNGLAITGLVQVGMLLERPDLVEAARRCARYLLDTHLVDGRLRRTSLGGRVSASPAVADDHGNLAQALLTLHQVDADPRWASAAYDLLDTALARFRADDGGFHDTADDAEALFARPRDPGDNAEPSGQSSLAHALLTAAALSGSEGYRAAAEEAVGASAALAGREPRFTGWTLAAAEALEAGPVQVAVSTDGEPSPLSRLAWLSPSPGLVTLAGREDTDGIPLLASRPLVEGRPTAYVCRGFVCDTPRTDVDEVKSALGVRATV
ncbi:thioredoxin domain-containing protein [Luteipulveratus flavus]|uniref:Thioredoxin domain-containing protein n=1 Tax=Luteipulveratus flavus TaxID=3031728 RepID=A0ABT6C4Q4_9MICO|nr:thioredoxin domain-containing protein [Luteipulveratus sp. YIM 133296]MDF8263277.1 thioredoxin domain-containing protein [Luteipulveratus sp. YIM 133296]